jgi:hypothetical protein
MGTHITDITHVILGIHDGKAEEYVPGYYDQYLGWNSVVCATV